MYQGECLCASVKYQVGEPITMVECCHCLVCRKAHSSAFSMGVTIKKGSFKIISGNGELQEYESSKGKFRVFCRKCGSQLYAYRPEIDSEIRLRPATLNADLTQFQLEHIHTENKLIP